MWTGQFAAAADAADWHLSYVRRVLKGALSKTAAEATAARAAAILLPLQLGEEKVEAHGLRGKSMGKGMSANLRSSVVRARATRGERGGGGGGRRGAVDGIGLSPSLKEKYKRV